MVVLSAEIRIEVIPISAILDVALNAATPSVVIQSASVDFPNVVVLSVVLSVVQVVARAVVVQYVQSAVYQCVADLDAMVVLRDDSPKVLPYDAQDVVPVPVVAQFGPDVVQSVADVAQVPQVSPVSAQRRAWLPVVQCAAAQAYCLPQERCVVFFHHPDCVCYRDPDVRHAVDPVTPASRDEAHLRLVPQVPDD